MNIIDVRPADNGAPRGMAQGVPEQSVALIDAATAAFGGWLRSAAVVGGLSLAGAVGLVSISAAPADATGVAMRNFGPVACSVPFKGCYDTGVFQHVLSGYGLKLDWHQARWTSAIPRCNWEVRFTYRDASGRPYGRDHTTPLHRGCSTNEVRVNSFSGAGRQFLPGKACAALFSEGNHLVSHCFKVKRKWTDR